MNTVLARFNNHIDKSSDLPCWRWTGTTEGELGYGRFLLDRRTQAAHRVSYMLNKGHICEGQIVRHSCDNPWCVNPDHLDLGTHAENAVDSVRRNRRTNQKRTEEQVKGFLDAYFETKSIAVAAERSGLPMKFATEVAVGKAWTWLSDNHPAASLRKPNRKRRTDTKYALEDVEKALRLVDEGATAASVARDTGLREGFILKILHGQTWKWLSDTHPVCVAYRERMRTKD